MLLPPSAARSLARLALLAAVSVLDSAGFSQETEVPPSLAPGEATDASAAVPAPSEDVAPDPQELHPEEYYELLSLFIDSLDQIDRNYVQKVGRRELMEAAIEGMMRKLDAHSSYINPEHLDELRTEVESEFGGLGIRITTRDNVLRVISPLDGTPAYRAGMTAGDAILSIDGATTEGMSSDEAVRRLKGPVGSTVRLVVLHAHERRPVTLDVTREIVRLQTVLGYRRRADHTWDYMLHDAQRIGYIRITSFGRYTGQELRDVLMQLKHDGMTSLVLDLRFNPGGLLSAAVEVSDLFLSAGKIVSTSGRNVEPRSWDAIAEGTFDGFRMAVLVNRYSASASEIVAAALQDHRRAVIVGERTWGKGSVQNIIELEGGKSALKLTTAGYRRPSGKNIQKYPGSQEGEWGVEPDPEWVVLVDDDEMYRLRQSQAELDVLQASALRPDGTRADGTPADSPQQPVAPAAQEDADNSSATPGTPVVPAFSDRQLEKALDYITSQVARR